MPWLRARMHACTFLRMYVQKSGFETAQNLTGKLKHPLFKYHPYCETLDARIASVIVKNVMLNFFTFKRRFKKKKTPVQSTRNTHIFFSRTRVLLRPAKNPSTQVLFATLPTTLGLLTFEPRQNVHHG